MKNKGLLWGSAFLVLLVAVYGFALLLKGSKGPDFTTGVGIDQKLDAQLPLDLAFNDETGKEVKLGDYFHKKPVILMFVFYQCKGTCLLEFAGTTKLVRDIKSEKIGRDYEIVTIGIHPKESFELAAAKKRANLSQINEPNAVDGWHYLTGSWENIQAAAASVGFRFTYDAQKDRVVHPTGIMVMTPQGKVSRYFYGIEYPSKTVMLAMDDARKERIGALSAILDFDCFQMDAATGRVTLNVKNAVKVAGLATLLILITSIVIMSRASKGGAATP